MNAISIFPITKELLKPWLKQQSSHLQTWVEQTGFKAEGNEVCLVSNKEGKLEKVLFGVKNFDDFLAWGKLPLLLPEQHAYCFDVSFDEKLKEKSAIGWGLGAYQFTQYKEPKREPSQLILSNKKTFQLIENTVNSICFIRDLINTPTDDMSPEILSKVAKQLAQDYQADFSEIVGESLLKQNFSAIYTVGRGSGHFSRLIELNWGRKSDLKITLVGKGVCFDSGGLDLKTASGMGLMKKDMSGAAHVLGLAKMIMAAKLPVRLRVLIPAVENMVSGSSYHPGDVIKMRSGLSVEVNNTDAEGRLILADALSEAVSEKPDLLIDIATLTGAARVALGTEIIPLFANHDETANQVLDVAKEENEAMWRMPLFKPYNDLLKSYIAELSNSGSKPYAGAITAALFLQHFVPDTIQWLHLDIFGWNEEASPGKPKGGEAFGIRTLFKVIQCLL